ncbi:MAG: ABC transporter substrate-binding protein [Peptococcaceae bacterium]
MTKDQRQVVVTRCPIGGASEIALQKGWLEEAMNRAGAELVVLQTLPPEEHIHHYDQDYPLCFREGGNNPPIWGKSKGIETKLIGLVGINQSHAVLVRPDSEIRSAADLRGKKLSVPCFAVNRIDFWQAMVRRGYKTILEYYGIKEDEVKFVEFTVKEKKDFRKVSGTDNSRWVYNKPQGTVPAHQEELEMLAAGDVDAIFAHGAMVAEIAELGLAKVLLDISKTNLLKVNNIYPITITVKKEFAVENPDLVIVYLQQLLRAAEWAKNNKEELCAMIARGQYDTTKQQVIKTRDHDFHLHMAPGFDPELVELLKLEKDFLRDNGFIQKDFAVDSWMDTSFLTEALKK